MNPRGRSELEYKMKKKRRLIKNKPSIRKSITNQLSKLKVEVRSKGSEAIVPSEALMAQMYLSTLGKGITP